MIIPNSPLLRAEDYDTETQKWIGRLLAPLNTFISSATAAINGRIAFVDNCLGQQKSLTFSYSSGTLPLSFVITSSVSTTWTPKSLAVVQATENGNPVIILAAWSVSGTSVKITDLVKLASGVASALTSGATYNLTVRIAA
jgi:hypothetical protein